MDVSKLSVLERVRLKQMQRAQSATSATDREKIQLKAKLSRLLHIASLLDSYAPYGTLLEGSFVRHVMVMDRNVMYIKEVTRKIMESQNMPTSECMNDTVQMHD